MKGLLTVLLCCLSFSAMAQWDCVNFLTFEPGDTLYPLVVEIDTIHYGNNKWQVGHPQKTVFETARYSLNAIVTDTTNTYPANDTSVFVLKIPMRVDLAFSPYDIVPIGRLKFLYKLDIDSSLVASIEMSVDSGVNWYNAVDTLPAYYSWLSSKPNLSISDTSWQLARLDLGPWGVYDTLLFRFTLISDTVASFRDGWMIDNIEIQYWCEGAAPEIQNPNLISLYPNPSKGNIHLHSLTTQQNATITVYNVQGQEVYKTDKPPQDGNLHLHLPNGIYTLKYTTDEEYCTRRITIIN
jgi:hypothetical protein